MTDPLGSGGMSGAVDDLQGLVTGTYVPVILGVIVTVTAIGVGFAWLRKGLRSFKRS